ncbi:MAG TPA: hypothetical protein VGL02_30140 [Streptomyces sp.]
MTAATIAPAAPEPSPAQFAVARSAEIARLRWAADLVGELGIQAYGTRVLPVQGGQR